MNLLQEAHDDTKNIIEMGCSIFSVNDKGIICKDDKPYLISTGGNDAGKVGLIIQDPLPDGEYFLINPYGEGGGVTSTPLNFFYRILLAGIVESLVVATTNVLILMIKASKKEIETVPPEVLRVVTSGKVGDDSIVDVIDARMLKEFEKIDALVSQRILLLFPPRKMRVSLHFENMTAEGLKADLGKSVRERTIQTYLAILYGILGIADESELSKFTTVFDPAIGGPPKMWCFTNTLLKIYLAIGGLLDEVGLFPKKLDLGKLTEIIERIPEVAKRARHNIDIEYGAGKSKPAQASAKSQQAAPQEKPGLSYKDRMLGRSAPEPAQQSRFGSTRKADDGVIMHRFDEPVSSQGFSGGWRRSSFDSFSDTRQSFGGGFSSSRDWNRGQENSFSTRRFS